MDIKCFYFDYQRIQNWIDENVTSFIIRISVFELIHLTRKFFERRSKIILLIQKYHSCLDISISSTRSTTSLFIS
jgi:hypothetical protein